MKGKVTLFSSINDTFKYLQGEGFWLIEDWNRGLIAGKGSLDTVKSELERLITEYEDNFKFKVFNKIFEISWGGEKGYLLQENNNGDFDITEQNLNLMIEGDWRRFGSMIAIKDYKWVRTKLYKKGGKTYFIRFMELLEDNNE
ncbi:MAG: hypothetical protein ACTSQE_14590 [Candidatus Heimdallarchaeaceae archaeon]